MLCGWGTPLTSLGRPTGRPPEIRLHEPHDRDERKQGKPIDQEGKPNHDNESQRRHRGKIKLLFLN